MANTRSYSVFFAIALAFASGCNGDEAGKVVPGADCPDLSGPAMVRIRAPNGASYCVDRTEVTEAQYAVFLKEATMQPGSEHASCAGENTTYQPLNHDPAPYEIQDCVQVFSPETTPNRPVVCVDWCDAYAYCKWAGKRLCGNVKGGANGSTNPSQWFNACSQGGETVYPYGNAYDPTACIGADLAYVDGGGWLPRADVGSSPSCRGQAEPYSEIFDMSGSVSEFTDDCISPLECAVRGGSYGDASSELTCGFRGFEWQGEWIGFRCCKDLT